MIQIAQEYNGKLQPLGFVNAHHLHTAAATGGLDCRGISGVQQPPQLGNERKQAAVVVGLKMLGVAAQSHEIFLPERTALHRAENSRQRQAVIDVPQKLAHADVHGRFPKLRKHL